MADITGGIVPQPSSLVPDAEAVAASPGSNPAKYSQEGHTHPRLTSTTMATIAIGTTVTVAFTRTFTNMPGMVMTEIEGDTAATAQPAIFKVQSWVKDGSNNYTGAVIKAWRAQTLPTNLTTLLLSGVYNLFTATVVGTTFSVVAIARSDV